MKDTILAEDAYGEIWKMIFTHAINVFIVLISERTIGSMLKVRKTMMNETANMRIKDRPNKVRAKLIIDVEGEFYDDESNAETLRYCVEQDLEDAGFNVIDSEIVDLAIKALEIELLTDTEQRIFLKAMSREREVCQKVDDEYSDNGSKLSLVEVCNSIERKVKKIWE